MDASAFFQSKGTYLNASHLATGELEVTVKAVEIERVGKEKEQKLVVYLDELPRGLVLNKTNYESLFEAFGPETEDWLERPITLFSIKTDFTDNDGKKKEVDGVRIRVDPANRLPREQRSTPKPLPIDDDDIPY